MLSAYRLYGIHDIQRRTLGSWEKKRLRNRHFRGSTNQDRDSGLTQDVTAAVGGHFGSQGGTREDIGSRSHSQGPNLKLREGGELPGNSEVFLSLQHPCQERDEMPSPFLFSFFCFFPRLSFST